MVNPMKPYESTLKSHTFQGPRISTYFNQGTRRSALATWPTSTSAARDRCPAPLPGARPAGFPRCVFLGIKKVGSLNVPMEHHPTIRYMVYNGYYKVMSNSPKMGHLPIPEKVVSYPQKSNNYSCNWILLLEHCSNRMRKHIVSLEIGVAYLVTPTMLCHMFIGKLKMSWISWKLLYNPFYPMEICKY